jgi:hypothetical protein
VLLYAEADASEVLPQPVVLESNPGTWIGLRFRLYDQWFDGLEFMDNPGQSGSLAIGIRNGKLDGQQNAK